MANESITEDLVEARLRDLGYYDDPDATVVEKQQSLVQEIRSAARRRRRPIRARAVW